jgi:flagellar biosynthesis component FlhA|tara:strand:+ start:321 stop:584 length:264 start_codon:yes stop_codon:yes gene_type:complete
MAKKITLKSGKKATLKEMSVDKFDECMDAVRFEEVDGQSIVKNQFGLSTLWIRNGVEKADDKYIKTLSINDRVELQLAIQEYNSLGE